MGTNHETMKELISATTGAISSQMILEHCGDYAGRFQDEAFNIFQQNFDSEFFLEDSEWADIMFDSKGNVYAVWAGDALTCQNAPCLYVQLDVEDCPEAFSGMQEKRAN